MTTVAAAAQIEAQVAAAAQSTLNSEVLVVGPQAGAAGCVELVQDHAVATGRLLQDEVSHAAAALIDDPHLGD